MLVARHSRSSTRECPSPLFSFFLFKVPPTTQIYTLSLHDALPISARPSQSPLSCRPPCCSNPGSMPMQNQKRGGRQDRKSTRLNSSHVSISYAVFCLKKKKKYN